MGTSTGRADLVIIGAGIQGASAAYYAALAGIKSVTLIEQAARPGRGATAATAAMIMHQTGDPRTTLMAKASLERYAQFGDEVGGDIGRTITGSLLYSDDLSRMSDFERWVADHNEAGVHTRLVSGEDVSDLTRGFLKNAEAYAGTYCPSDGYVDAQAVVRCYITAASRKGAVFLPSSCAVDIEVRGARIVAVHLADGTCVQTDAVLNCGGWGARTVASWLGRTMPLRRNHRNMLILRSEAGELPNGVPIVEDVVTEWYFRPHRQGFLLGVGPTDWLQNDDPAAPEYDAAYHEAALEYVAATTDAFSGVEIVARWAGHRPMIDPEVSRLGAIYDDLPLVGAVSGLDGYFESCGWGAFGVTFGPIGGEMAVSALSSTTSPIDLAPFSPTRFE